MRNILKNILYKSTQSIDEELLFKMNITGDTPEETRSDGIPLDSENMLKLPASLEEERFFPSSSTPSSSQSRPIYYSQEEINKKEKEKARRKVYSKLMTHVTEYMKDDGQKFNKNKKTVLFKEDNVDAYIYPLEEEDLFGYLYHRIELVPYDSVHFRPHMTRNFNFYLKRETKLTHEQSLELFDTHLKTAEKR